MKKSLGARTVLVPAPVLVVGTYDKDGRPNVMTVAWGGTCCSSPPCIDIALRKATHSYQSILDRKAFTVHVTPERYLTEADYFGIVSGRDVDKFAATGLTAVRSDVVDAPYIKEFPFVMECRLFKVVELGLHTQFIGEIMDVKTDDDMLDDRALPDVDGIKPVVMVPEIRRYYGFGEKLGDAFVVGKRLRGR
ncbi:MAG: flavin reductase family protein [Syntrophorhabdaceae bacterium]|nr:flavin reductase family protein [Syntrophorhabdaceae bacterium]